MAKYIYGVDLGTTQACISYVDANGHATVIENLEGSKTTPSVACFVNSGVVTVGQAAKDLSVQKPERTASFVKTQMGRTNFAISCDGHDFPPEAVSAEILKKLASDARKRTGKEVKDVVITCPAYFGTAERSATRAAGEIAGLNVIEIISEPTAAAVYYGCVKEPGQKTVLVYDLGGGTFDVTVMRIADGKIEEICKDGNHQLGGIHWDEALMQYLAAEFFAETDFDGEFDDHIQQDLRLRAENAKHQLTDREEVEVVLNAGGHQACISVSRSDFEDITAALLNESMDITERAMDIAAQKGFRVDEIILVGGSTRMPQVTRTMRERFGMVPKVLEPDEAVAKGAAIYALSAYEEKAGQWRRRVESGEVEMEDELIEIELERYEEPLEVSISSIPTLSGKKTTEIFELVANKSYALKVLLGGREVCYNFIVKNRKMKDNMVNITKSLGLSEDGLITAELAVYESDHLTEYFEVDEMLKLGHATLDLPVTLPAGSPIQVTFTLDQEGILRVTGYDPVSMNKIEATMNSASGTTMSAKDIAAAKARSAKIVVR